MNSFKTLVKKFFMDQHNLSLNVFLVYLFITTLISLSFVFLSLVSTLGDLL